MLRYCTVLTPICAKYQELQPVYNEMAAVKVKSVLAAPICMTAIAVASHLAQLSITISLPGHR